MATNDQRIPIPWRVYGSEFLGTALLVGMGLSFVILDFGRGSPIVSLLPDAGLRRLLTGFLFGSTGALIALSPLGKESGAHINPVVSVAFWLMGRLRVDHTLGYVLSQLAGAVAGALPLLLWGTMGQSIDYGATLPGAAAGTLWALVGEVVTTFALIAGLFSFVRHQQLRRYTPALFPILYAIMVWLEAPISGTSTNPARSLGPALISGNWRDWWVYWLGPAAGMLIGVFLFRSKRLRTVEIEVAKLYYFEHDRYGIFGSHAAH